MELLIILVVVGTSIWVLIDSTNIGAKKGMIDGVFDMGTGGWFISCLLLWIIAFPAYLVTRPKIRDAARDPYGARQIFAATGKRLSGYGQPRVGKWSDPVNDWEKKQSTTASASIHVVTLDCPLCGNKIPALSIRVGTNVCPECNGAFEAEAS